MLYFNICYIIKLILNLTKPFSKKDYMKQYLKSKKEKADFKKNLEKYKRNFSKIMMIFPTIMCVSVTIFSFYMMYKTNDISCLVYLIPSSYTAFGWSFTIYSRKARAENIIKLSKDNNIPIEEAKELLGNEENTIEE